MKEFNVPTIKTEDFLRTTQILASCPNITDDARAVIAAMIMALVADKKDIEIIDNFLFKENPFIKTEKNLNEVI